MGSIKVVRRREGLPDKVRWVRQPDAEETTTVPLARRCRKSSPVRYIDPSALTEGRETPRSGALRSDDEQWTAAVHATHADYEITPLPNGMVRVTIRPCDIRAFVQSL